MSGASAPLTREATTSRVFRTASLRIVVGTTCGVVVGDVLFVLGFGFIGALLARDLSGCTDYQKRVRYRLVPFFW